jgi:putative hydrolases of HD superfamily
MIVFQLSTLLRLLVVSLFLLACVALTTPTPTSAAMATTPSPTTALSSSTATTGSTSASSSISNYVTFISTICGKLKDIKRTGWVRSGIPLPESDADHMHRCAMCAMLIVQYQHEQGQELQHDLPQPYPPNQVDANKLLKMAVTHDLCESLAGDITPHCDPTLVSNKEAREQAAMEQIRTLVGDPLGEELFHLWREYEDQNTLEAIYCKDIDKFEMVVQAFEYEQKHLLHKHQVDDATRDLDDNNNSTNTTADVFHQPLRGFFASTSASIKTPLFQKMDRELRERREIMLKERGWEVTQKERQQQL